MKKSILSVATIFLFVIGIGNYLAAQNLVTWKGGAPGREHEWNCPKNWSNSRVPNGFSNVVIPDITTQSLAAPIINDGVFEVNSIQVLSNAELTINKDAQLVVYYMGDDNMNKERIHVKGSLFILDDAVSVSAKNGFAQQ